jgi:hypothetical protein
MFSVGSRFPKMFHRPPTTGDYWRLTLQNAGKKFLQRKKKDKSSLNMKS